MVQAQTRENYSIGFLGLPYKAPHTLLIKQQACIGSHSMEAGSPRSRCQQGWFILRTLGASILSLSPSFRWLAGHCWPSLAAVASIWSLHCHVTLKSHCLPSVSGSKFPIFIRTSFPPFYKDILFWAHPNDFILTHLCKNPICK